MRVLRFLLVLALVVSSLGVSSLCLTAATCGVSEVETAGGCHDEGPTMGRACCCSDEIGSDPAAVATDREVLSQASLHIATTHATADGVDRSAGLTIEGRPPSSSTDRQSLFCVYLT